MARNLRLTVGMKVAGRKNDGAWFRTNQQIATLTSAEQTALETIILAGPDSAHTTGGTGGRGAEVGPAPVFTDMQHLATKAGVTMTYTTASDWVNRMISTGIPRQVWLGNQTWATYTKTGGKYTKDGQANFRKFAKFLRRVVTMFIRARAELLDEQDDSSASNPGGVPNV